jgi:signal transduction histidine kinase
MQSDSIILVWVASLANMEVVSRLLQRAGLDFRACGTIDALIAQVAHGVGALLIEDEVLTAPVLEKLTGFLNEQPPWSDLPVILLAKRVVNTPWSWRISRLTVLEQPVTSPVLVSVLRMALNARQRQYEVRNLLTKLQRSNEDLERFAYISSHDLQEPVRMVGIYTGMLAHKYKDKLDAEGNQYIDFALEGAARIKNLIKDLLAYSRINTDAREFQPTDTGAVLRQVLDNLQIAIRETNAQVTHDELPTVEADVTQLEQVFQNLIENAIKYRRNDEPPKIHVTAEKKDDQWLFKICDNGMGIDPGFHDQVFVAFKRLHADRGKYPGTGIGLAIVKRIVERHQGRVWVESKPGEGSTFYFTIPISSGGRRRS